MKHSLRLCRFLLLGMLACAYSHTAIAAPFGTLSETGQTTSIPRSKANPIEELILQGEAFRAKGHLTEAENRFQQALELAQQSGDIKYQSLATGMYGYILFLKQDYGEAKALIQTALTQAKDAGLPVLAAIHGNHLGNYYTARRQWPQANSVYSEALSSAKQAKDAALIARIQVNQIRLDRRRDKTAAWKRLKQIRDSVSAVESLGERTSLLLAAGYQAAKMVDYQAADRGQRIQIARLLLNEALSLARQINHARFQSMAIGYLGMIDEGLGRNTEALKLTDEAVKVLYGFGDEDLLLQWEWQRGRLLKATGDDSTALAAYRRAVSHIEAIRGDIPVEYQNGRSSFRETLQPVYLGLADLLIEKANTTEDRETVQSLLRKARNTVELIKKTELEDYFNNRCAIQTIPEIEIETLAPQTAALYPIVLDDRLELLVSLPGGIFHKRVAVPRASVEKNAKLLAHRLRNYLKETKKPAIQLYQWLIAPISELLTRHNIDTLVFVPDGVLRLVPLAALYDGHHYVVENYAVATSPGLTLFDPKPLSRQMTNMLLAGLSVPGPVIGTLPDSYLQLLLDAVATDSEEQDRGVKKTRDISSRMSAPITTERTEQTLTESKIRSLLNQPAVYSSIRDFLSLPGVNTELETLSQVFPTTTLVNETFARQRVDQEINQSRYNIIHIASHGVFGNSSDESFIMAHDKIITIDQLEAMLSVESLKDRPIELLTLSACQTAEGDDRSPLGISGIAIKAKVRSVLGSLWSVDDGATVAFMASFYEQLQNPSISKARAMQHAQQQLLKHETYNHPSFWSPFLLIGNWL